MAKYLWGFIILLVLVIGAFLVFKNKKPKIDDIVKLKFDDKDDKDSQEFLKKNNLNESFLLDVEQLKNKDEYTKKSLTKLLKKYDVEI